MISSHFTLQVSLHRPRGFARRRLKFGTKTDFLGSARLSIELKTINPISVVDQREVVEVSCMCVCVADIGFGYFPNFPNPFEKCLRSDLIVKSTYWTDYAYPASSKMDCRGLAKK